MVGEALINIKANELWREEHSGKPYQTWEDYIEKAWGYISRAKRLMQAAKLHSKLSEAGMSDDDFRRIISHEAHADKLSRATSLSDEDAKVFVEKVTKKRDSADFESAKEALETVKPAKKKPEPLEIPAKERKKLLVQALDKAKDSFESKIEAIFDEFGDPDAVDTWLKKFAEDILRRLCK